MPGWSNTRICELRTMVSTSKRNLNNKENIVKYAKCRDCGEEYSFRRKELGYITCLDCGQRSASMIANYRTRENLRNMAPHSFTGSAEDLFDKHGS